MNPVDNAAAHDIASRYIALWNEAEPQRRLQLLQSGWTPDARYADPLAQAHGHEGISTLVGAVQARYPGFRFALLGQAEGHGEHLRFSWTLGSASAADLIQGTDYVHLQDGKLRSVTGFLDKVPVGA